MLAEQSALLRLPPYANGTLERTQIFRTAIGAASASANVLGASAFAPLTPTGAYVSWIADTDCYVAWANGSGPAVTAINAMFMPAGVLFEFWHRPIDNVVSVIQKTTGGSLFHWLSNP
jgi:hypothetical protein